MGNYKYVKILAKKRSHIIQEILDATLNHFPTHVEENRFAFEVSHAIETLFLTDHCVEVDGPNSVEEKTKLLDQGFLCTKSTKSTKSKAQPKALKIDTSADRQL